MKVDSPKQIGQLKLANRFYARKRIVQRFRRNSPSRTVKTVSKGNITGLFMYIVPIYNKNKPIRGFSPRTITPIPCPNCIDIVFCSRTCRDEALAFYHRYECGILETIWKSGASINALMALRIITRRPLEYFKNLRTELTDDLTYEKVKQ